MNFLNKSNSQNLKSGLSVVELLVGIFILTLVGVAVANFFIDLFSFNRTTVDSLSSQDEIRKVFKTMSAEIRSSSPSSIGAYPLLQTATSSFTFYSNIDADVLKERVRYFLSGTTLKKGTIKPSGNPLTYNPANEAFIDLAHNVINGATPVFAYYDTNYDGTTGPLSEPIDTQAVRLVKITVMIDSDPVQPPPQRTATTQVSIRNLKDNY